MTGPVFTRRRLLGGAAAISALTLAPWRSRSAPGRTPVLSGAEFQLEIGAEPLNITGRPVTGTGINGQIPAPILRWREGDTVALAVTNRLSEPSSIHWHGVRTPSPMDGVPGLSFHGIAPGETFVYRFPVRQSGTYWYHSHSAFQEQTGVYGPIVIVPRGGYAEAFDRDYVVMLSDWTDENPGRIVSNLKFQSDYYNYAQRTLGGFVADAQRRGLAEAVGDRQRDGIAFAAAQDRGRDLAVDAGRRHRPAADVHRHRSDLELKLGAAENRRARRRNRVTQRVGEN